MRTRDLKADRGLLLWAERRLSTNRRATGAALDWRTVFRGLGRRRGEIRVEPDRQAEVLDGVVVLVLAAGLRAPNQRTRNRPKTTT